MLHGVVRRNSIQSLSHVEITKSKQIEYSFALSHQQTENNVLFIFLLNVGGVVVGKVSSFTVVLGPAVVVITTPLVVVG